MAAHSSGNAATHSSVLGPSSSMWSSACWRLLAVTFTMVRATIASLSATCSSLRRFVSLAVVSIIASRGEAVLVAVLKTKNITGQMKAPVPLRPLEGSLLLRTAPSMTCRCTGATRPLHGKSSPSSPRAFGGLLAVASSKPSYSVRR